MGFFLLYIVAVLVLPIIIYAGLSFLFTRKSIYWQTFKYTSLTLLLFGLVLFFLRWLNSDITLKKSDFYGNYIINRNYFKGKNADWQYHHYRFTIRSDDSVFFYVTNHEKVICTYKGKMFCNDNYPSSRIRFEMEKPVHHIFSEQPLITRDRWHFVLVMYSPLYHNMYFEKSN